MKTLLLIGISGHTESVLDSAYSTNSYGAFHLCEPGASLDSDFHGLTVHGGEAHVREMIACGVTEAFIACGSIGGYGKRLRYYQLALQLGLQLINVVDSSATVSPLAEMGHGIFVGKRGVVNAYARIGNQVIINTGASVDHSAQISAFTNIAPGCVLCGSVSTGVAAYIGAGSVVRERSHIGAGSFVGMGSLVLSDVADNMLAYGRPCKTMRDYPPDGPNSLDTW